MENLIDLLDKHAFFEGLKPEWVKLISECGSQVHRKANEYFFREGEDADAFYIIRRGNVAMEIFSPGRGPLIIQTEGENEVIGWSWLFPPYKWFLDARAIDDVTAIALDGRCLRTKCDADPALGYELMKRFAAIVIERLQATRVRLIDIYGPVAESKGA